MPTKRIGLQASNGQWVCAEGGGGRELVANRNARGIWETFTVVPLGGDQVALRAYNGNYVSADQNITLRMTADRETLGPWEQFAMLDQGGGSFAFRTHTGKYVCAEKGGGQEVIGNRDAIGPWETFSVADVPYDAAACAQTSNELNAAEVDLKNVMDNAPDPPTETWKATVTGLNMKIDSLRLRLELDC